MMKKRMTNRCFIKVDMDVAVAVAVAVDTGIIWGSSLDIECTIYLEALQHCMSL